MNKLLENEQLKFFLETEFEVNRPSIKKQLSLIQESILSKVSLAEVLNSKGMTYDSLEYFFNTKPEFKNDKVFTLEDFKAKSNGIPVVSFFSGAGGLDLGFEALGFDHNLLIEKIPLFCETLKFNRPDWTVFTGDVSKREEISQVIQKEIGKSNSFEGVFIGGPPCQPFSIAANQRFSKKGENFKRVGFSHETNGNLLFDYIHQIKTFRPKVFLIENVPGLIEVDGGEQLKLAYEDLEKCGYKINKPLIIKASNHKVPQQRIRLFIIGSRSGNNLSSLESSDSSFVCGSVFDQSIEGAENHITRAHSAESVLRYMKLSYGKRDQLGRVDRLDPSKPSKTIIAGGTKGGGRSHLHPYIPRTLSVRESARLQTFPEDYIFTGPVARQFTQVGNAVPPVLASQLAKIIKDSFYN